MEILDSYLFLDLILRVICKELLKIRHKWFLIGVQLGVARHVLKQFQKSEEDPLSAVIDYWLNGNADPAISICWKSVIEAVEAVQESGLAAKIRNNYCHESADQLEKGLLHIIDTKNQFKHPSDLCTLKLSA